MQEQARRRHRHNERMKRRMEKEKKKGKKGTYDITMELKIEILELSLSGRKGRKKHQVEESPDEDIEPVHAVDIVEEEMPEVRGQRTCLSFVVGLQFFL